MRERIYPQYESNAKIHKFVDSLQQEVTNYLHIFDIIIVILLV